MAVFSVTYTYTDDDLARDAHRAEHRAYLAEQPGLLVSGPFNDYPAGALLLFSAQDEDEVSAILDGDPFGLQGLVAERVIREFAPVLGPLADNFAAADDA